ncbi:hypothetical protein [Acinetobacter junii]|uniref:hypothetical protein n=1 Tax=Acinetobacter junii TaxID=40215 RepID=UPI003A87CD89
MTKMTYDQALEQMDNLLVNQGSYAANLEMIKSFVSNISGKVYDDLGNEIKMTKFAYK